MLAVLMYHDVVCGGGKYANDPQMLRAHLEYVRAHHPVVLPGELPSRNGLAVCLTFDDGHASFYWTVYPMLQELGVKAVLSVSTDFILDDCDLTPEKRARTPSQQGRTETDCQAKTCFCTWKELREMQSSGLVQVACHSAGHKDLTAPGMDMDKEIVAAGQTIQARLGIFPSTFVFPLGRVNSRVRRKAAEHYTYLLRIGEAVNKDWGNPGRLTYRLQGDCLRDERGPLRSFWKSRLRFYWNSLRLR